MPAKRKTAKGRAPAKKGKRGPGRPPGSGPGPLGPTPVTRALGEMQARYKAERRHVEKRAREVERQLQKTIDSVFASADRLAVRLEEQLEKVRETLAILRPKVKKSAGG